MERPKNITDQQWQTAVEIYNSAKRQGDKYPELTVAQAALETGWFKKPSGKNNYFGQKATAKQAGTTLRTTEVANNKAYKINDKFRDYNTIDEAVSDRIKKWGSKYQDASNIEEAISRIWKYDSKKGQGVGYATDPQYGNKVKSILGTLGTTGLSSENIQLSPQEQPQTGYVGMLPTELPEVYGQPYVAEEETKTEEKEAPKRTDNANKLAFVADYEELSKQYEQQLQAQQKPLLQQEIVEGVAYQPIQQNFQEGGTKNKVLKTTDKVVEASFIGKMLGYIPVAETVYDIKNIISGLGEGDYKKIGANTVGALLPGVSGKAFEAVAEDWLPETPEIEKKKMKFNINTSPAKRQEYLKKYGAGYLNNPKFIKEVLDKYQEGGIKIDPQGYWNPDNEGKPVIIPSPSISMKNVDYPIYGKSLETGEVKLMTPNNEYFFANTQNVLEQPVNFQIGGEFIEIDRGEGKLETINTDSDEYRQLYNEGRVLGVEGDTLLANTLPEITLTGLRGSSFTGQEVDTSNINIEDERLLPTTVKDKISGTIEDKTLTAEDTKMFDKEVEEVQKKITEEKITKREDLDVKEDSTIEKIDPRSEKDVLEVQKMLSSKGYNLNPEGKFKNEGIDGKLGKVTQTAIEQYNKSLSQPTYNTYKKGEGFLGYCSEEQCSEFVQNENFRNLKPNIPRQKFNELTGLSGDAWTIGKNIEKAGGKKIPIDKVKEGDVITLFTGGRSPYLDQAKKAGTDATHTAIIDQVNPDGSYYILHNVHELDKVKTALKGSKQWRGKEYRNLVKNGQIVGDTNTGFTVRDAYRPNYKEVKDFEKKVKVRDDIALIIDENKLEKLRSFNKSFTGADINVNINTYLTSLNNTEAKKTIAVKHGLSETDYQSISKVALGILGQETGFGTSDKADVKRIGAEVREAFGGTEASRGDAQVKYETNYGGSDLNELGINKDNFKNKDKIPLVVVDIIANHYKYYIKKGESKEKALYKAVEKYNRGRSTKYSETYDSDYVNKVLNFADYFDVKDKEGQSYRTIQDELVTKDNVVKRKIRSNF